jgi:hypothetical protein
MPANMNMSAAGDLLGGVGQKLGLSFQRLVIAGASLIGILFALLPWHNTQDWALARTNIGMFSSLCSWAAVIGYAAAIGICFLGDRAIPLGKIKFAAVGGAVFSLLAALFFVLVYNATDVAKIEAGNVVFLVFISAIVAVCVAAIPFIKKLEG